MSFFTKNLCGIALILMGAVAWGDVSATPAPNPRGGASSAASAQTAPANSSSRPDAKRTTTASATTARTARARGTTSRAGAGTTATGTPPATQNVSARTGRTVARMATTGVATAAGGATKSRAASMNLARSLAGTHTGASAARSAMIWGGTSRAGVSRAGTSRATAVFSDISKIGGGYATCRDAYATCMDQFCANANDTYRRCFCSERFTEFRDTEDKLDQATLMLMQFQDNNLNAVDKTAAEVNAMYSATEGERAIKNDVSGAAQLLNNISDMLSGKKSSSSYKNSSTTSLGVLSLDFSSSMDDIWSGDGGSLFGGGSNVNMTALEGDELYDAANRQCLQVIKDSCENNAVLNMSKSAYGIMIAQDCNAYQKSVDAKKETVQQTVRTAEKYLREARLEEYRAHNSADVNECLTNVRAAMMNDAACGENYKRCLDPTGAYINPATGEPLYSARLFQLADLIVLGGVDSSLDILAQNPDFNKHLDSLKSHAATALDSCRTISDTVWTEFKRAALIEIAQAQDDKIESVKMSCVSTMAECYDSKTSQLRDMDTNTAKVAGAISAYSARAMCEEKVVACAALYGDTENCTFKDGKLTSPSGDCGLTQLLNFVDTVDSVRVAEGCATAIETRLQELCTPVVVDKENNLGYPWKCVNKSYSDLKKEIDNYVAQYCTDVGNDNNPDAFAQEIERTTSRLLEEITEQLSYMMSNKCEDLDGYWVEKGGEYNQSGGTESAKFLLAFYNATAAGNTPSPTDDAVGFCYENTKRMSCLNFNDPELETKYATYDTAKDECIFTDAWYQERCAILGPGKWENNACYVKSGAASTIKEPDAATQEDYKKRYGLMWQIHWKKDQLLLLQ